MGACTHVHVPMHTYTRTHNIIKDKNIYLKKFQRHFSICQLAEFKPTKTSVPRMHGPHLKDREAMRSRPRSPSCYLSLHCCLLLPTGLGLRAKASRLSNPELSTYSLLSCETSGLKLVELRLPCSGEALWDGPVQA